MITKTTIIHDLLETYGAMSNQAIQRALVLKGIAITDQEIRASINALIAEGRLTVAGCGLTPSFKLREEK